MAVENVLTLVSAWCVLLNTTVILLRGALHAEPSTLPVSLVQTRLSALSVQSTTTSTETTALSASPPSKGAPLASTQRLVSRVLATTTSTQ